MRKKVLIITTNGHPCACYLARSLRSTGAEIYVLNQNLTSSKTNSWNYFKNLLHRRGLWTFIDNLLLFFYNKLFYYYSKILSHLKQLLFNIFFFNEPDNQNNGSFRPNKPINQCKVDFPAFKPDPNLRNEDWLMWLDTEQVNSEIGCSLINKIKPDIILLAGAPILKAKTIEHIQASIINPHYGITPYYSGSDSPIWAIYKNDWDRIGFTIHYVVPKVDSGPIIYQEIVKDWDPRWSLLEIGRCIAQCMYDKYISISSKIIENGEQPEGIHLSSTNILPPAGLFVRMHANFNKKRLLRRSLHDRPSD